MAKSKKITVEVDPTLVGYVRVSTEEQNPDMQIAALERHGVHPENIHTEKVSGASPKRPARDMARRQLRPGMTLVVWKLDRLGRNHMDLYSFVQGLADEGIGVRSITEYIDTTSPIGKFVLIMLSAAAQFERELIRERTMAGIARAKERGVRFGRESVMSQSVRDTVERAIIDGRSVAQSAALAGVAESTVRKYYKAPELAKLRSDKKPKRKAK